MKELRDLKDLTIHVVLYAVVVRPRPHHLRSGHLNHRMGISSNLEFQGRDFPQKSEVPAIYPPLWELPRSLGMSYRTAHIIFGPGTCGSKEGSYLRLIDFF